jgi:hypothetical protein
MKATTLLYILLVWFISVQSFVQAQADTRLRWEENKNKPKELSIQVKPNFPNPFDEQTTIQFNVAKPQVVTITLYSVLGVRMATIFKEEVNSGEHEVVFKRPADLPDGMYMYTVETPTQSRTLRMIMRKAS